MFLHILSFFQALWGNGSSQKHEFGGEGFSACKSICLKTPEKATMCMYTLAKGSFLPGRKK